MKKKIENHNLIIIILLLFLIFILLINLVNQFMILDKKEIYTSIIVSDHVGFDLNGTALTFGMVQPEKSASRSLLVENNFIFSSKVNVGVRGNITDFLIVSDNNFILNPGERIKLDFVAVPSKDALFGKYDGFIIITLKRNIKLSRN